MKIVMLDEGGWIQKEHHFPELECDDPAVRTAWFWLWARLKSIDDERRFYEALERARAGAQAAGD